ncbi:putative peptide maturation dehydrogenase [Xanthomonas arboricola]|nr:putative peptide maturation dehydrogenase [Xanthomonas arboricola]
MVVMIRRCFIVYIEPRDFVEIDFADLCAGGAGTLRTQGWVALAPHLGSECRITEDEVLLLGRFSPNHWREVNIVDDMAVITSLLSKGLLIEADADLNQVHQRDNAQRESQWHPLAATYHAFTRWDNVDSAQATKDAGAETADELTETFGPPPPEQCLRGSSEPIPLPRGTNGYLDEILQRRTTCRNFDGEAVIGVDVFAKVMERTFAANAVLKAGEGIAFLKRSSPSGGGLHPLDAYLVIRNISGLIDGIYHYLPVDHALERLQLGGSDINRIALEILAGQDWFANAQVIVALCPRYLRNFWKYRAHAKAYRALALEAGHFSQTLYLAATDAGLGAFVTCAINEIQLENLFGLEPVTEGILAVCGFGVRGQRMETMELDPNNEVWSRC